MNQTSDPVMPPQPEHVLLVDDDEFMSELVTEMLRDLGVNQITTAADGSKGLAELQGAIRPPDVIICDINMPNTDGFQMMEALAKERNGCGFILISGLESRYVNSAALMAKFHHLNILGALRKPIDRGALATLLSKWRPQATQ